MKATLYKLKEGHVLCSNEGSKKGELTIFPNTENGVISNLDGCVPKIAEHDYGSNGVYNLKVLSQSPDFSLLSEEGVKRIGCFDVENIALQFYPIDICKERGYPIHNIGDDFNETQRNDFIKGFQKHEELTADRMFTEEDVRIAIIQAFFYGMKRTKEIADARKSIIQNLLQPKSWEVEYKEENGVYKVLSVS